MCVYTSYVCRMTECFTCECHVTGGIAFCSMIGSGAKKVQELEGQLEVSTRYHGGIQKAADLPPLGYHLLMPSSSSIVLCQLLRCMYSQGTQIS